MNVFKTLTGASALLCLATFATSVEAAKPGCEADPGKPIPDGNQKFENAPRADAIQRVGNPAFYLLDVKMAHNKIAGCDVNLRSYNGGLTGGTMRVNPGGTLRILVRNFLDKNPHQPGANPNIPPHMPNTTNFHSHGFHVSPDGIADNVLRQMPPRAEDTEDKNQYLPYLNPTLRGEYPVVIDLPENHPSGTFWYHAHIHGSTAMQVSSGMAGALIVPGGLDNVPEIKAAADNEKIMLFQQIAYNEDGEITDYSTLGSSWWNSHNRRTTINGQIAPVIEMRPGEIQRWRMIHGGINEAIKISIVNADVLAAHDADKSNPAPEQVLLNEIAVDGLATGRCDSWKTVTLYPGYRSDVLIKAPSAPGTYLVLDAESDQLESLYEQAEPREVLARITVAGSANDMRLPCGPGELASYKAIKDITPQEYAANKGETQSIKMSFVGQFGAVNDIPYDANNEPRKLKLGTIGKWELNTGSHPFHIHVNPFQTTRPGPDGQNQIVWRDTYRTGVNAGNGVPPVEIMSRYEVFTGNFVLHCHILDHEDKGMMEQVEIVAN
ncbi:MAG: multicopper oxidase domain-containing protein [Alphaproteobacteria bacterium]|nr:multicopper oxidase domain-containing protein [Alphaproteobacteria bacterium]